ncbi:LOW QUALITY PROTEIN: hypothetical protein BC936DRAFT_146400 [Jimgerdemannia flammicorona]|uniref:Uncharacterized protein n=1 Tax=Jimgerdemannia flammicorona TaxID=994334 RepID=A0A433DLH0_9FUNG|nr:LOW QUALITY PROTEIN: hypothetical protein BC936DRAFT_146400 [Jimgerdemannia flammicorona]
MACMVRVDNTLGAASYAVKNIVKEEADDYVVIVLSDANITQYNIKPHDIARMDGNSFRRFADPEYDALRGNNNVTSQHNFITTLPVLITFLVLKSDERVTAQMVFIGSLEDQAEQLKKALGSHAHICKENKELPKIMKSIFLSSMLKV